MAAASSSASSTSAVPTASSASGPAALQQLPEPPTDGISSARFAPRSHTLAATSWDGTLRLYDASKLKPLLVLSPSSSSSTSAPSEEEDPEPQLDCAFGANDDTVFAGGLDGAVRMWDVPTGAARLLGSHTGTVKSLWFDRTSNTLFSGGWDGVLSQWDPRLGNKPVHAVVLPPTPVSSGGSASTASGTPSAPKVYSMDGAGAHYKLVVAGSERRVDIFDTRHLARPLHLGRSPLTSQTRCVRCCPDGRSFTIGSLEGRVAIEVFPAGGSDALSQQQSSASASASAPAQSQAFAFKCHRKTGADGVQTLYPVNALAYHPTYWGTFATGGSDGVVSVWDGGARKRICSLPPFATSVAALDFSFDGALLATAASYLWEEGERTHPADALWVRRVTDSQVRLKGAATGAVAAAGAAKGSTGA